MKTKTFEIRDQWFKIAEQLLFKNINGITSEEIYKVDKLIKENYGLEQCPIEKGWYFTITDEKKFFLFLLKYNIPLRA